MRYYELLYLSTIRHQLLDLHLGFASLHPERHKRNHGMWAMSVFSDLNDYVVNCQWAISPTLLLHNKSHGLEYSCSFLAFKQAKVNCQTGSIIAFIHKLPSYDEHSNSTVAQEQSILQFKFNSNSIARSDSLILKELTMDLTTNTSSATSTTLPYV